MLFLPAATTSRCRRSVGLSIVLVCLSAGFVESATVTLAWDPSPGSGVAGYVLSYGTTSGAYTSNIDVGGTTTFQFSEPDPTKVYYLAVRAYNIDGLLGPYSNQVSTTPAVEPVQPLTVTNLSANLPSPQPVGTTVAFTAAATGSGAPYQYKWWISDGTTTTVGRNWSTSNSFAWTPAAPNPNYIVTVWARKASSTIDSYDNPAARLSLSFAIVHTPTTPGVVSLVQHSGKDAGTTRSSKLAFVTTNTAGNWIGVVIRAGRTGQTFTVRDTRGNTYRRAVLLNDTAGGTTVALFYAENIAGGANTVTVTNTLRNSTLRFAIMEYAGVAKSSSLDGTAASQGYGTTPNSGPVTTTADGNLIVGVFSSAAPVTFAAGSGYTLLDQVPAAPNTRLATEDRRRVSAGPVSATATISTASNWAAVVAAFRAGAVPGGTVANLSPISGSTAP